MSTDPRDEVLEIIHDFAINLLIRDDLPPEVEHDVELIHALARYGVNILSTDDRERLAKIRESTEGERFNKQES